MTETFIRTVPPKPKGYGWLGLLAGLILSAGLFWCWSQTLPMAQKENLGAYAKSSALAPFSGALNFKKTHKPSRNEFIRDYLQQHVYGGEDVLTVAMVPLIAGFVLTIGLVIFGLTRDNKVMNELRAGRVMKGPRVVDCAAMNKINRKNKDAPGIGLRLESGGTYYIPARKESEHFLFAGSTGSGKTSAVMQIVDQVAGRRGEQRALIIDQTGVLKERYFRADLGDIDLNVYGRGCPSWNPSWELSGNRLMDEAILLAMGESLYPARSTLASEGGDFWTNQAVELWTQLYSQTPPSSPAELAYWMDHQEEIERRVKGTRFESSLDHDSKGLRNSIMAYFCSPKLAFSAIPPPSGENPRFSVKEWCENGKGWLFLTSTKDTAKALKPYYSLICDMVMGRLMSQGVRPNQIATWIIIDEFGNLQRLSKIKEILSEGRKYNVRTVIAFQEKTGVKANYGEDEAETLLSQPGTRLYMRIGDEKAAAWAARQCGDQRVEQLEETYTSKNGDRTVRTSEKDRPVYLGSEFMGMPDMEGVLRQGNYLMKVKFPQIPQIKLCEAFIPREDVPLPVPQEFTEADEMDEQEREPEAVAAAPAPTRNSRLYRREKQ